MEMLIVHLLIRGKIALVIKVEQTRATLAGISKRKYLYLSSVLYT